MLFPAALITMGETRAGSATSLNGFEEKMIANYDDGWRCEVCFQPDLDELFGVTHTKQEVHLTERLLSLLEPDNERIARKLNGRARRVRECGSADSFGSTDCNGQRFFRKNGIAIDKDPGK